MSEEIEWRDIIGFNGKYQVSSDGRVRIKKTQKEMCICKSGHGKYFSISLFLPTKKYKRYFIHRLVACAFVENPYNKPFVDHIDGNKYNNNASNLKWVTNLENARNPITLKRRKELMKVIHKTLNIGEKISKTKSAPDFVEKHREAFEKVWEFNTKKVRCIENGLVWKSSKELAEYLGVCLISVRLYCRNKVWCGKTVTFADGSVIVRPHFEYVTEEEENTNV